MDFHKQISHNEKKSCWIFKERNWHSTSEEQKPQYFLQTSEGYCSSLSESHSTNPKEKKSCRMSNTISHEWRDAMFIHILMWLPFQISCKAYRNYMYGLKVIREEKKNFFFQF